MNNKLNLSFSIPFFIVFALIMTVISVTAAPIDEEKYLEITIGEGDTLWSLSKRYKEYHQLTEQKFINWVTQQNRIQGSTLFPGQQIYIPVKIEDVAGLRTELKNS
jgi:hypothetical protein